jgi:hypothetical protein
MELSKNRKNLKGYPHVTIDGKTVTTHRLVAEAFIPNPEKHKQVHHIDGNKENNYTTNLEWCDNLYNNHKAYEDGLKDISGLKPIRGVNKVCPETGKILREYKSVNEAAKDISSHTTNISRAARNNTKHRDFLWVYNEIN